MVQERQSASGRPLKVCRFAAVHSAAGETRLLGGALAFKQLPARVVRRLSVLEKGVISCLLGLGEDLGDTPIVLASRYGAMANTLGLLKAIGEGETMSPTAFSLSVHNAAVGVASQLAGNHGPHTAISAGADSFLYGVVECESLLANGAAQVVLLYSDCALPDEYAVFDDMRDDLQLALLLTEGGVGPVSATGGTDDAFNMLKALESGAEALNWTR